MVKTPLAAEIVPLVARSSVWIITLAPQPEKNAWGKLLGQGLSGSLLAEGISPGVPPCGAVMVIGVPRQPERGLTKTQTVNWRFAAWLSVPKPKSLAPISLRDHWRYGASIGVALVP